MKLVAQQWTISEVYQFLPFTRRLIIASRYGNTLVTKCYSTFYKHALTRAPLLLTRPFIPITTPLCHCHPHFFHFTQNPDFWNAIALWPPGLVFALHVPFQTFVPNRYPPSPLHLPSDPWTRLVVVGTGSRPLFPQWSHHVYPQFLPGGHPAHRHPHCKLECHVNNNAHRLGYHRARGTGRQMEDSRWSPLIYALLILC